MLTVREQKRDRFVTREQLMKTVVSRPETASDRWQGIHHGELANTIVDQLESHNVKITDESWYLAGREDSRLTGSLNLEIPKTDAPEGMTYSLGVHHGNDKCYALKFAIGGQVFICQNGIVSGDYVIKRLHTSRFNLVDAVRDGLGQYLNQITQLGDTVEAMKAKEMTDKTVDSVLMAAGRQHLMPWSRIGKVDKEFRKPTFAAFKDRNAWGLYNAFTYVIQKSPPQEQISGITRFRELVMEEAA